MEFLKGSFLKTYANTPINLRDNIILVLKKSGPISWYTAYLEIKNNTEVSKEILEGLRQLKLI